MTSPATPATPSTPAAASWRLWPRAGGARSERDSDRKLAARIRELAGRLASRPAEELAAQISQLRREAEAAAPEPDRASLAPAFALATEAVRRVLGIALYDVQLLGGLALARGAIAEMQTGEGKTLAAAAPACWLALAGRGVHVMTVNAYLAERDCGLLAPVFRLLGISCGLIQAESDPRGKRDAYACDITYGPGYEFGFDYLRDQVALLARRRPGLGDRFRTRLRGAESELPQPIQRGHASAIVDEADSVMLDEATTPLILAANGNQPAPNAAVYQSAREAAARLDRDRDYLVDESAPFVQLTEQGRQRLVRGLDGVPIPQQGLERPWHAYVLQALRADRVFRRDFHYIVRDGEVQIVDQHTGRVFADRSWRDGLQQAVQAKEGVTVTTETRSLARITRQRYLRLYGHLCGMTGTAQGSERELRGAYGRRVAVIPCHKPCRRASLPLRVFADRGAKERAIVADIAERQAAGQPVLVGAADIETSERLSRLLDEQRLAHRLLNGKQDAEEAEIVAAAGQLGAVTIATNMAGRGTDIALAPGAAERGGLHVIVAEPQESARIDRQLVGRAARQGDPGSCQLFASADDALLSCHAPSLARRIRSAALQGEAPRGIDWAARISKAQRRVECDQARRRRQMFAHDDWLDKLLGEMSSDH